MNIDDRTVSQIYSLAANRQTHRWQPEESMSLVPTRMTTLVFEVREVVKREFVQRVDHYAHISMVQEEDC